MSFEKIRLGTRSSRLAMIQAEYAAGLLKDSLKMDVEIVAFETKGDQVTDRPLREIGSKGVFTLELEEALLSGELDLALHCLKDMPTQEPKGLSVLAHLPRGPVEDCLVFARDKAPKAYLIEDLPQGFRVGTSAVRRRAQLLLKNPGLEIVDMRGNLDTRVKKLLDGQCDALCLALAGLERAGFLQDERIQVLTLSERDFLPCAAQGVLVLQGASKSPLKRKLKKLSDPTTETCAGFERQLLARFEGGCSLPLAVFSEIVDGELILKALLMSEDGQDSITLSEATRDLGDPILVDNMLAEVKERGKSHLIPRPDAS